MNKLSRTLSSGSNKSLIVEGEFESPYGYTQPRIHGMVYDPAAGKLHQMAIDFERTLGEFELLSCSNA